MTTEELGLAASTLWVVIAAVLVLFMQAGFAFLEAGLTRPGSVRGVVLLAPSPAFRRLRQYVPVVRLVTPRLGALPVLMHSRMAAEGLKAMFSDPSRLPDTWFDAYADEMVRSLADRAHRVAFLACARQIYLEDAYGRNGFWQRLPGLLPPALFVWGDRDRLVPSSFARHVARGCVPLEVPDASTLRRDVDTAQQLREAVLLGLGPRTARLLAIGS